jgi:hypothetical protein
MWLGVPSRVTFTDSTSTRCIDDGEENQALAWFSPFKERYSIQTFTPSKVVPEEGPAYPTSRDELFANFSVELIFAFGIPARVTKVPSFVTSAKRHLSKVVRRRHLVDTEPGEVLQYGYLYDDSTDLDAVVRTPRADKRVKRSVQSLSSKSGQNSLTVTARSSEPAQVEGEPGANAWGLEDQRLKDPVREAQQQFAERKADEAIPDLVVGTQMYAAWGITREIPHIVHVPNFITLSQPDLCKELETNPAARTRMIRKFLEVSRTAELYYSALDDLRRWEVQQKDKHPVTARSPPPTIPRPSELYGAAQYQIDQSQVVGDPRATLTRDQRYQNQQQHFRAYRAQHPQVAQYSSPPQGPEGYDSMSGGPHLTPREPISHRSPVPSVSPEDRARVSDRYIESAPYKPYDPNYHQPPR